MEEQNKSQQNVTIDDSKLTMENMDNLNEYELSALERKYKDDKLPRHRLYALVPYNIVFGGLSIYLTLNFRRISRNYFKPKNFGIVELFKYGTVVSTVFVSTYIFGTCLTTGLWTPVKYVRDIAKIQGQQIDNSIRFDDQAQQYLLFNTLEYFGLDKTLKQAAENELNKQKEDLLKRGYFSKESLELMEQQLEERKEEESKNK